MMSLFRTSSTGIESGADRIGRCQIDLECTVSVRRLLPNRDAGSRGSIVVDRPSGASDVRSPNLRDDSVLYSIDMLYTINTGK